MNDWRKLGGAAFLLLAISLVAGCPAENGLDIKRPSEIQAEAESLAADTVYQNIVKVADTVSVDSVP